MDPLEADLDLTVESLAGDPLNPQFGQWVAITPPETAVDWREFLEAGYNKTIEFLESKGYVPVGDPQWIEHGPNDIYTGGTYGWKQSFVVRMK